MFCMSNDNEKPRAEIKIKRPIDKVPTSYVHSNISFDKNGKLIYEGGYRNLTKEEDEKIAKMYQRKLKAKEEERNAVNASTKSSSNPGKAKRTSSSSIDKYNLYKRLGITKEDKTLLSDVIKYSLTEREIKIFKSYFGSQYDGYYRSSCGPETKNSASKIVSKLEQYIKEAKKALKEGKINGRIYLLNIKAKSKLEYVDPNTFNSVSKNVFNNVFYYRLTEEERRTFKLYLNQEDMTDDELITFLNEVAPKMKTYLFEKNSINSYLKAFTSKEQKVVKAVVAMFSLSDKAILKKKFGPKYDGNNTSSLTSSEINHFKNSIRDKLKDKHRELLNYKDTTSYYLAIIKGFSNIDIEKRCNVTDDIDRKILLDILETISDNDKEILFTTNQIGEKSKSQLIASRDRIITSIKKGIIKLKKVYYSKDEYARQLENLFNNVSLEEKKLEQLNASLKNYLEISPLSILQDTINYGLNEEEQHFLQKLFAADYSKEILLSKKKEIEEFNNINMKINSLVTYLNGLNEEEHEAFVLRLKKFPKEEEYNEYQHKDLSNFIGLPYDDDMRFIIRYGLNEEECLLLQKRVGLTYEGFLALKIKDNEKYYVSKVKEKIKQQYALLKENPNLDDAKKIELINKPIKKVKSPQSYKYTSLIDYLGIKEEQLETFYNLIKTIFNSEELEKLQKRFGPLYDGVNAQKVDKEDNLFIFSYLIPRLKSHINKKVRKPRKERGYKRITLKEYLNLTEEEYLNKELAISTISFDEVNILKKRFGSNYDGENSEKITSQERNALNISIKPKLLRAFKVINETDEKDLAKELNKVTSKNKFGYKILSLYDALSLSLDDKEVLINSINKIFNEEEIILFQKRFGASYDGVDIEGVTKEENQNINANYIPRLRNEIDKYLGRKKERSKYGYRIKSLFEYLNIQEEEKKILLDIIDILSARDKKMFQKRFGKDCDGKGTVEITEKEKNRIFVTLMPKIKEMFLILKEVPQDDYDKTLKVLAYKYRITRKNKRSTLIRVMSLSDYEKEQERIPKPKAILKRVTNIEDISVVHKLDFAKVKEEKEPTDKQSQSGYRIQTLKEFLGLQDEEEFKIKYILITLTKEDIIILQKRFGQNYDGVCSIGLDYKEKNALNSTINERLQNALQVINETDEKELAKELNKLASKNKFGYKNLSLYETIPLTIDNKEEILNNVIHNIFNGKVIELLKKRFGPLYDGVDIEGVTKEENKLLNSNYIPILRNEINKELGLKRSYRIKSLFKYLHIKEDKQSIVLDVINLFALEDQKLLQKRFGEKFDGKNTSEITPLEEKRVKELIPQIYDYYLILSVTPKKELQEALIKMGSKNHRGEKVIKVEEVNVERTRKTNEECTIYFSSISKLLKIIEEEKGISQTKLSLEEVKEGIDSYSKNLELCSLGFTKEEILFLLLGTNVGLNLSLKEISSFLKVSEEDLRQLYLDCTEKIKTIIGEELDNYISLIKEKSDSNE